MWEVNNIRMLKYDSLVQPFKQQSGPNQGGMRSIPSPVSSDLSVLRVCVAHAENGGGWEASGDHCAGLQEEQRHQHRPDRPPPAPHHQDRHPQL